MGYMQAFGNCAACGRMFSFNPDLVPSARVRGIKEPICKPCVLNANPKRVALGLEPIPIHPGAYDAQEVL